MSTGPGKWSTGVERTYVADDDFELPPLEELMAGTEWWLR
jgi:hypothetical protein